jgi:hypothetical protein
MGLPKIPLRMMFPLQHADSNPNRDEKFKIRFSETISHNPNLQSLQLKRSMEAYARSLREALLEHGKIRSLGQQVGHICVLTDTG